ncbi:12811_t:CDS:2 [Acaulospora morrowiae]|uniref:12811_t:CDS:1 n=1 Tax=Acaulospora morrowiae TaxID=94023 RepID=A0A9N8VM92_9GLOM|nr:12811_t:CDS:2 [Acaulospora morrowiae]
MLKVPPRICPVDPAYILLIRMATTTGIILEIITINAADAIVLVYLIDPIRELICNVLLTLGESVNYNKFIDIRPHKFSGSSRGIFVYVLFMSRVHQLYHHFVDSCMLALSWHIWYNFPVLIEPISHSAFNYKSLCMVLSSCQFCLFRVYQVAVTLKKHLAFGMVPLGDSISHESSSTMYLYRYGNGRMSEQMSTL